MILKHHQIDIFVPVHLHRDYVMNLVDTLMNLCQVIINTYMYQIFQSFNLKKQRSSVKLSIFYKIQGAQMGSFKKKQLEVGSRFWAKISRLSTKKKQFQLEKQLYNRQCLLVCLSVLKQNPQTAKNQSIHPPSSFILDFSASLNAKVTPKKMMSILFQSNNPSERPKINKIYEFKI